ncbi:MAG: response regulator transcription factor [Actinomycetota bacterium]
MKVLLVEDDDSIAEPLTRGLRKLGYTVARAATGRAALEPHEADLVLLDLGLPDMDGYEVCRTLRARSEVPIIVITARSEEVDRVIGLELGADDYVVKPFGFRELVARIRAVTRRTGRDGGARAPQRAGRVSLDRRTRRVTVDDAEVKLTTKEFDLLALLMEDPGSVFERRRILEEVWDTDWIGGSKRLDVHVAALRKKLGDPTLIETVRGVGFRVVEADSLA